MNSQTINSNETRKYYQLTDGTEIYEYRMMDDDELSLEQYRAKRYTDQKIWWEIAPYC